MPDARPGKTIDRRLPDDLLGLPAGRNRLTILAEGIFSLVSPERPQPPVVYLPSRRSQAERIEQTIRLVIRLRTTRSPVIYPMSAASSGKTVLLVEDDPDDVFAIKRALRKIPAIGTVQHCQDGHEAILHLSRALVDKSAARPDLVLTDLNMPRKDGLEVLSWIRTQRPLQGIPVVILTTSEKPEDLQRAKRLGVRQYVIKDPSCQHIVKFIEKLFG